MAQLRSFKYFANPEDEADRPSTSGESSRTGEGTRAGSASSSGSSYTVSGGNLTSETSGWVDGRTPTSGSADQKLAAQVVEDTKSNQEDESTTISSSEEYQMARHDLEDDVETVGSRESPKSEKLAEQLARRLESNRLPGAKTPLTPRLPLKGGVPIMFDHQQSPRLGFRNQVPVGGDAASQLSFGRFGGAPTKHFEIRWHNISLSARRPLGIAQLIRENPLFRLLGGSSQAEERGNESLGLDGCYSPPLKHKLAPMPEHAEWAGGPAEEKEPTELGAKTESEGKSRFRPILTNISGSVFSGQLTAILGPSGVGKTMLLNSLTGRNTLDGTGRVDLLGGASKRMSVVTVPQADILPGKLTALEDLLFTSRLKNPQRGFNHERNIKRIVRHLQMEKFLGTRIDKLSGGEARRLSIGRELLNSPDIMILDEPTSGLDANTCKKIISALRDIVEHSQDILDRPMSIIITIHQPQQEVLNLFHRVYVMARSELGTRSIYEGPPSNLLATLLEASSLASVCSVEQLNENPAIVALEVASGEYGPQIVEELAMNHERQTFEEMQPLYSAPGSPYMTLQMRSAGRRSPATSVTPRLDLLRRTARLSSIDEGAARGSPKVRSAAAGANQTGGDHLSAITSLSYASTYDADLPEPVAPKLKVDKRLRRSVVMRGDFISQTSTLMARCWLLTTRDLFLMSIRILGFLLVAGGMVQIFSGALDPNEHQCPIYESEVEDVFSYVTQTKNRLLQLQTTLKQASSTHLFFFHLVLCITMVTSALTGLVFPLQMRMFVREYKNGWYSPAAFITSQTLAELPVDIIGPTISLLITYPLCNQPPSDYYWREMAYIFVLSLASIICKSQAQIVGAFLMDSVENSVFISCVVVTVPALLSGIAVRVNQMIWPLQIMSYGSFLRYAFESLFLLRYGYGICPCDSDIVHGYPIKVTPDAIPPQLDTLARGFIELNTNSTIPPLSNDQLAEATNNATAEIIRSIESNHDNLFVSFLRLVTEASNRFVQDPTQLGDCSQYRSLYLMDMDIQDNILFRWVSIMLFMFVISRFITYFVIKTVIRARRKC